MNCAWRGLVLRAQRWRKWLKQPASPGLCSGTMSEIVIVLLGTLVGDLYATGQETRAQLAGCTDALTYLGEPAVLSVGTLFQAALLPGIFLAGLYAAYAFGFALVNPSKAPAVEMGGSTNNEPVTRNEALTCGPKLERSGLAAKDSCTPIRSP